MPPGDILIHAGDFTVSGLHKEIKQFRDWLRELPYEHKIVIAGNHERFPSFLGILKGYCTLLENETIRVMGLTLFGSKWKFDWSQIPKCDILITHKPPKGHGDVIYTGESRGNAELYDRVLQIKPMLHIFGHNHEGYGMTQNANTSFVNAATCIGGAKSSMRRSAMIIDIYPDYKHLYTGLKK
eukprot:TRINITY_DN1274_c0_g1_i2.p1 TRINITY_DN1274_c0_g1~~TRINITY_DN1274_c0_g1_i2.p1  ORF type:complete len:183 (+),score=17.09 TRINITY_DN1274_c0_g1_i2:243-791(+)